MPPTFALDQANASLYPREANGNIPRLSSLDRFIADGADIVNRGGISGNL